MSVYLHCVDVYSICAWYSERPEEGTGSPRSGVTESCELFCRSWELSLGPLSHCSKLLIRLPNPSASFLIQPRLAYIAVLPPKVGWALPHQAPIKQYLKHMANLIWEITQQRLSDDSGLCEADRWTSTVLEFGCEVSTTGSWSRGPLALDNAGNGGNVGIQGLTGVTGHTRHLLRYLLLLSFLSTMSSFCDTLLFPWHSVSPGLQNLWSQGRRMEDFEIIW